MILTRRTFSVCFFISPKEHIKRKVLFLDFNIFSPKEIRANFDTGFDRNGYPSASVCVFASEKKSSQPAFELLKNILNWKSLFALFLGIINVFVKFLTQYHWMNSMFTILKSRCVIHSLTLKHMRDKRKDSIIRAIIVSQITILLYRQHVTWTYAIMLWLQWEYINLFIHF